METSTPIPFAKTPCVIAGIETVSGTFRPQSVLDGFPAPYDFSGSIANVLSGSFSIQNPNYATIGVHIDAPESGIVGFYGTFDGSSYTPITFRQVGSDGYSQQNSISSDTLGQHDYIGSIASLRAIKFILTTTGVSGSGTIVGRLSAPVSTLEGIENSSPPHKFGNQPFHKGIYINNTTGSGVLVYQPPTGMRFVITDVNLSVFSAGANITLYEDAGLANPDTWVYSTYVKTTSNDTQIINCNFSTPFVASGLNNGLYLTVDATSTIRGTVQGYYAA